MPDKVTGYLSEVGFPARDWLWNKPSPLMATWHGL